MYKKVMAIFSGTEFSEAVLDKAIGLAKDTRAALVLLEVRNLNQADRLGTILDSTSFVGRGMVEELKRTVKEQRSHSIKRALTSMSKRAEEAGLTVTTLECKGDLQSSVSEVVFDEQVDIIVMQKKGGKFSPPAGVDLLRV